MTDFFADMANRPCPRAACSTSAAATRTRWEMLPPPITNPLTPPERFPRSTQRKSATTTTPPTTDRQISEAMAARVINAIASEPGVWEKSAIIITYDESDGFYDHVPPRILSYGPDGLPLSRGVRVPLILISPYARTHAVSHAEGDHNAIIETINDIFGLPLSRAFPTRPRPRAGN